MAGARKQPGPMDPRKELFQLIIDLLQVEKDPFAAAVKKGIIDRYKRGSSLKDAILFLQNSYEQALRTDNNALAMQIDLAISAATNASAPAEDKTLQHEQERKKALDASEEKLQATIAALVVAMETREREMAFNDASIKGIPGGVGWKENSKIKQPKDIVDRTAQRMTADFISKKWTAEELGPKNAEFKGLMRDLEKGNIELEAVLEFFSNLQLKDIPKAPEPRERAPAPKQIVRIHLPPGQAGSGGSMLFRAPRQQLEKPERTYQSILQENIKALELAKLPADLDNQRRDILTTLTKAKSFDFAIEFLDRKVETLKNLASAGEGLNQADVKTLNAFIEKLTAITIELLKAAPAQPGYYI